VLRNARRPYLFTVPLLGDDLRAKSPALRGDQPRRGPVFRECSIGTGGRGDIRVVFHGIQVCEQRTGPARYKVINEENRRPTPRFPLSCERLNGSGRTPGARGRQPSSAILMCGSPSGRPLFLSLGNGGGNTKLTETVRYPIKAPVFCQRNRRD